MKLPSFHYLLSNARHTLHRFPLTLLTSAIAVFIGIYLVENQNDVKNYFPYVNLMLTASIGIPLFFSATIISGKRKLDAKRHWLLMLLVVILLAIIYFTLPNAESTHNTALPYIKYAIYNITAHLLVSFIPFVFSKQINGFWQHNKILFIRIFTSILFSGVLYIGLVLALFSMKLLFEIDLHEELFLDIYIFIAGIFNTWFFLTGIPEDFDELDAIEMYPKGLKIFAQYILLSLLALYLVILYFYAGKILLSWDWPKGIVSYLIICVSILGILTFLLLYPYGNQTGNEWIKKSSKLFYVILIPLLVILFIAILMRIDDYGITIKRYVVLFLGIWLCVVCAYTILGKTNIKFIPVSLAVMLLLISFGPWGMFSVSEHYQVKRLKAILEKSNILKEGKIQNESVFKKNVERLDFKNEKLLSDSLHNEVYSILDYMDDFHGFSAIRSWYSQNIDSLVDAKMKSKNSNYYNETELYMNAMGLEYENRYEADADNEYINFNTSWDEKILNVKGYDYTMSFSDYIYGNVESNVCSFDLDSVSFTVKYKSDKQQHLMLELNEEKPIEFKQDTFNFNQVMQRLIEDNGNDDKNIAPEKMELKASIKNIEVKLQINSLEIKKSKEGHKMESMSGNLFVRKLGG
jgi:hypothetical protein